MAAPRTSSWSSRPRGSSRRKPALTFANGYAAALGVLPALVGKGDSVLLDKRSHACLIDAARLSGATVRVFPTTASPSSSACSPPPVTTLPTELEH